MLERIMPISPENNEVESIAAIGSHQTLQIAKEPLLIPMQPKKYIANPNNNPHPLPIDSSTLPLLNI